MIQHGVTFKLEHASHAHSMVQWHTALDTCKTGLILKAGTVVVQGSATIAHSTNVKSLEPINWSEKNEKDSMVLLRLTRLEAKIRECRPAGLHRPTFREKQHTVQATRKSLKLLKTTQLSKNLRRLETDQLLRINLSSRNINEGIANTNTSAENQMCCKSCCKKSKCQQMTKHWRKVQEKTRSHLKNDRLSMLNNPSPSEESKNRCRLIY